jgi:hypothetical protein
VAVRAKKEGTEMDSKVTLNAFLDGGSSEPEVQITVSGWDLDAGLTFVQIDRGDSGTLAGLLLDEFQVGELIAALQDRPHMAVDTNLCTGKVR